MISLVNVFVKYTKEFYALSNINLSASRGEVVALVGPKDSGKTCLIRVLAGLEKVEKGEVYIKDIPINKIDYKTDIAMGYIPYKAYFFDKKTVYDNLKYVLDIRKQDKSIIAEKINEATIDFRLEQIINQKIYKLSLFQKYLVSIARLSFRKLDFVLIDNIFEELSLEENIELFNLIKKYFINKNTLVLFATSEEKIARVVASKIYFINNGAIINEENLQETFEERLEKEFLLNVKDNQINKNSKVKKVSNIKTDKSKSTNNSSKKKTKSTKNKKV